MKEKRREKDNLYSERTNEDGNEIKLRRKKKAKNDLISTLCIVLCYRNLPPRPHKFKKINLNSFVPGLIIIIFNTFSNYSSHGT
jgi:hypothetical protein